MHISLIWAMASNGVIGQSNTLPWSLPKDMRHFMRTTMSKPVIMGRNTFESMNAPLPGRLNIVVSSKAAKPVEGVRWAGSIEEAVGIAVEQGEADGVDELFIAGGSRIYASGLTLATRLYVTFVHATLNGDTFFPPIDWSQWRATDVRDYPVDDKHRYTFTIATFERA